LDKEELILEVKRLRIK